GRLKLAVGSFDERLAKPLPEEGLPLSRGPVFEGLASFAAVIERQVVVPLSSGTSANRFLKSPHQESGISAELSTCSLGMTRRAPRWSRARIRNPPGVSAECLWLAICWSDRKGNL